MMTKTAPTATSPSWPDLDALLQEIEIRMDDPEKAREAHETFTAYAHVATANTELALDVQADDDTYVAQWKAIVLKALSFTQLEEDLTHLSRRGSHGRAIWDALRTLDGYMGGIHLTKSQKSRMHEFIKSAHQDNEAITVAEVIDLAAQEDKLSHHSDDEPSVSSAACAHMLLERLAVTPTQTRVHTLARRAAFARLARSDDETDA